MKRNFRNFIKNFKTKNLYIFIGKVTTFLLIEMLIANVGLYVFNNCITTIK